MKKLMDRIGETVKGRLSEAKLTPLDDEIRKIILRKFARNGKPFTSEEIAGRLRLSVETVNQVIKKLQKADILSWRRVLLSISFAPPSIWKNGERKILHIEMVRYIHLTKHWNTAGLYSEIF